MLPRPLLSQETQRNCETQVVSVSTAKNLEQHPLDMDGKGRDARFVPCPPPDQGPTRRLPLLCLTSIDYPHLTVEETEADGRKPLTQEGADNAS